MIQSARHGLIRMVACLAFMQTLIVTANAHMAWLATDDQGHALFWFGESLQDRTYHLPASIAAIELASASNDQIIPTTAVDGDLLIGLRSEAVVDSTSELSGTIVYGLYHGTKLTYHVEHLPQRDPATWPNKLRSDAKFQTLINLSPDGGVVVTLLKEGKPMAEVAVKLYSETGQETGQSVTDAAGIATFTTSEIKPGLNAVMIGVTDKDNRGVLDGQPYGSSADYLTATFYFPGKSKATQDAKETQSESPAPVVDPDSSVRIVPAGLPKLPEELTSFGGAIAGNKIYVYGGHTGDAHSYSVAEQSNRLWCLDLADTTMGWQSGAEGPRLQGLALVAWGDRVVRIGGFTAVNAAGETHDLRSTAAVAYYDPANKTWTDLADLPEPRSSLDAAVIGDTVYVFGGWQLQGDNDSHQWHPSAWSLDLADPNAKWNALAKPSFQRRAVSVAAFQNRLYVIGGMQTTGEATTQVDIYDPANDSWSVGPSIPGSGMSGFGSAAFAVENQLYVSTMDGFVHSIDGAAQHWTTLAKVEPARFFHRMLPAGGNLLLIGGANMRVGKFTEIDSIDLVGSNTPR